MGEALMLPKFIPELQTKTVAPTGDEIVVSPDEGYDGLEQITIEGDANLIAPNIKDGVTIYGIEGSLAECVEGNLQDKTATPTGEYFDVTADAEYDGLGTVTVEGDANLSPENIADGITIYGVTGTLVIGSDGTLPGEYDSYVAAAEAIYGGTYSNKMVLENNGYVTVGFLMSDFAVMAYDSGTKEFSASGWYCCGYNKSTQTWTQNDYTSSASTGGNFISNIRYSTCNLYYNAAQIYPTSGTISGGSTIKPVYIDIGGGRILQIPEKILSRDYVYVSDIPFITEEELPS